MLFTADKQIHRKKKVLRGATIVRAVKTSVYVYNFVAIESKYSLSNGLLLVLVFMVAPFRYLPPVKNLTVSVFFRAYLLVTNFKGLR